MMNRAAAGDRSLGHHAWRTSTVTSCTVALHTSIYLDCIPRQSPHLSRKVLVSLVIEAAVTGQTLNSGSKG